MYQELQRKKRKRNIQTAAGETAEKVEELVLAAEELPAISQTLRELSEYAAANKRSTVAFTAAQATSIQDTFKCVICRDVMNVPVVAPCCRSLIGCNTCISEWVMTSPNCPKCRDNTFREARFCLTGLEEILEILHPVIRG
ncbi:uncharacterized protein LOC110368136 [Fundulus heteroclitus]|uniref:uncharacterized protein LOC110368136 n=1 Tax=Fundulus heteroclitus TaxID=8078 RepID=UPI00165A3E41|nr:uncharacterized protein LOC110368136 [Fundulus heteroclitus]